MKKIFAVMFLLAGCTLQERQRMQDDYQADELQRLKHHADICSTLCRQVIGAKRWSTGGAQHLCECGGDL